MREVALPEQAPAGADQVGDALVTAQRGLDRELARRIGNPKACRAVGLANGTNPIPIIVPCHRVVGSTGKLTGFAGGLDAKALLLRAPPRRTAPFVDKVLNMSALRPFVARQAASGRWELWMDPVQAETIRAQSSSAPSA